METAGNRKSRAVPFPWRQALNDNYPSAEGVNLSTDLRHDHPRGKPARTFPSLGAGSMVPPMDSKRSQTAATCSSRLTRQVMYGSIHS